MAAWPNIPLEDTFGDCVRKALRGNGIDALELARHTGIDPLDIEAWLEDRSSASGSQARDVARVLRLDPEKFAERAAGTWAPPAIHVDDVRRHSQLPHPSNGYVFFIEGAKHAALVDPAGDPSHLLRIVRDGKYHLQYILITHKHADHCDAAAEVAAAFPNAQIVMHELDVHAIGTLAEEAHFVRDGDELPFGADARIRMLHTPGHTDGSVCYVYNSTIFTGDTLFSDSVGGCFGNDYGYADILNSISSKIFSLPDDTVIMPGHGPPTTVALEKAHNPFF